MNIIITITTTTTITTITTSTLAKYSHNDNKRTHKRSTLNDLVDLAAAIRNMWRTVGFAAQSPIHTYPSALNPQIATTSLSL